MGYAPLETEVWFRNPRLYVKELVETKTLNVIWDISVLVPKRIASDRFMNLYYPAGFEWRCIVVLRHGIKGAYEIDPRTTTENPKAHIPVWEYGEDLRQLEEWMAVNSYPGNEHRVIVVGFPVLNDPAGMDFMHMLAEMQLDYPYCKVHVHGLYGFKTMFGLGFGAVDMEARTTAANGRVFMPFGKELYVDQTLEYGHWVRMLGFSFADLKIPRNRCMFNIEAAKWAGKNFRSEPRFVSTKRRSTDFVSSDMDFVPDETKLKLSAARKKSEGDKFLCNTCTLQTYCKSYRYGAVCSVPGAETVPLANLFKTRDSDKIIEGLGTLMATQSRRLDQGLKNESEDEDQKLDPEVTKIIGQMMSNGIKLAKLVDPSLTPTSKVNVLNVMPGAGEAAPNGAILVAQVVKALESQGIKREDVTPAMLESVLGATVINQNGEPA